MKLFLYLSIMMSVCLFAGCSTGKATGIKTEVEALEKAMPIVLQVEPAQVTVVPQPNHTDLIVRGVTDEELQREMVTRVNLFKMSNSFEGRPLKPIKISFE